MSGMLRFWVAGVVCCLLLLCNMDQAWSLAKRARSKDRVVDNTRTAPVPGRAQEPEIRDILVPDIRSPKINITDQYVPEVRVPVDQHTTGNAGDRQRGRDRDFPETKSRDIFVPEISMRDPGGKMLQRSTTTVRSSPVSKRVSKPSVKRRPPQASYSANTAARSVPIAPRPVNNSNQPKKKVHFAQTLGTVSKILDAGTVEVALANGRTERVRYEGFDSSSLDDPTLLELNRQLTEGKIVLIDSRRSERDDQGNLLAKVYIGNADSSELTLVNSELGKRQPAKAPEKSTDAPTS